MRRYANYAFAAAGVLLLLTTWKAPSFLGWWFTPPIPVPISCNNAVEWGTTRLVQSQFYSILIGLVAGVVIAFVTRAKAGSQTTLPPAATGAPAAVPPEAAQNKK